MIKSSYTSYSTIVAGEEVEHEWKERYDIACPHCEHEMQTAPSVFQRMGDSQMGYACCTQCDTGIRIVHDIETNTMEAKDINDDL